MTRAKRNLIITWNTGYSYMLDTYKISSRFLMEIPKEYTYDDKPKPKVEYTSNMMQSSMSHLTNFEKESKIS